MPLDWNSKETRPSFVFADRHQRAAERRSQDERHQCDRNRECEQQEIVEGVWTVRDVDNRGTQMDRGTLKSTQTIVATGEIIPTIGNVEGHLTESHGDHGEIHTAPANDQQT